MTGASEVMGFDMQTGYTGTITQGTNDIQLGTSGFNLVAGTFVGSTNFLDMVGDFNQSGGTFTAGAQNIYME